MAVIPEAIKYVAIIYKPSFFVAVAPEAIKYVAFIYKPSLTCRHLRADHSGTRMIRMLSLPMLFLGHEAQNSLPFEVFSRN